LNRNRISTFIAVADRSNNFAAIAKRRVKVAPKIVHRDIKPENIIVRPDGYAKILDFGLAKLIERKPIGFEDETAKQNETVEGVILGTVNYMSPEQAKGERVDERTDIFSLGAVVYEMIAGRTPFAGDSMSETFANLINAEPQPLSYFVVNVPDEMQQIVAKTLRKTKTSVIKR
jgi:serine/threonine protein kinase